MALANTEALRRAGVGPDTSEPEDGRIDRDPSTGAPTGILRRVLGHGASPPARSFAATQLCDAFTLFALARRRQGCGGPAGPRRQGPSKNCAASGLRCLRPQTPATNGGATWCSRPHLHRETAMRLVSSVVPLPSAEARRAAVLAAARYALSRGITSVVDFGRCAAAHVGAVLPLTARVGGRGGWP